MEIRSSELRKPGICKLHEEITLAIASLLFPFHLFRFPAAMCLKELLFVIKECKNLRWKADHNVKIQHVV